jgi:tRNA-Thr(GGU) m(6)t(6)A37 methyltransferase TsaA
LDRAGKEPVSPRDDEPEATGHAKADQLVCRPIGYVRSITRGKGLLEHQPDPEHSRGGVIELIGGHDFEVALCDLAGFSRIWLLFWFHRNHGWRPKVLPPRGRVGRRGLFATRAPYRPNPIGLTSVPLLKVQGRKLLIGPHDLLDGTPILDIKPYLPSYDSYPEEREGWLETLEESGPAYELLFSPLAQQQMQWLETHYHPDFPSRVRRLLESDPYPHKTRRITRQPDEFRLGCGAWRVYFLIEGKQVLIRRIDSGLYEPSDNPEAGVHRRFRAESWEA